MSPSRRQFISVAAVTLGAVSGCLSGTGGDDGGATAGDDGAATSEDAETSEGSTDGSPTTGRGTPVPAGVPTADRRLPLPMEPGQLRENAISGGPPKDGIPSIDDPQVVAPDAVDFLDPGDPVFGVVRDGTAKAYPQKILVSHEVVNDELAGTNVAVTYCPLTGTAQGFERGETTFGVSGRLINNNLVMYDRATEAWWPQIPATAIPGPWNENPAISSLREFRVVWTTWERWQEHNPDTGVLSTDTGHARNYGSDPYGSYNPPDGYYADDTLLFGALNPDDRYDRKTVVMGARTPDGAAAFLKDSLRDRRTMTGDLGGESVLAVHDPGLDTAYVYRNPDGESYEFAGGAYVGPDGAEHAPDSFSLSRVLTVDAMWFAWAGYYPETTVYE